MKRVTASQARRNWFRLLDEVAAGETVVIERHGRRIVLSREAEGVREEVPEYGDLIRASDPDRADRWRWSWIGEEGELTPGDGDDA